jgi:rhodanese-related sulfurtransferase
MAPYTFGHLTATLVTLAIGFFFGFVLERAGFGNARNLAAQFYLHDMRVLKVMFTAIVTAMLFVFFASALGLLDFARVWVPPTYFWPGVLGGFVLGIGFIIGGYCPGTSLVAVSTLKLDGIVYAAGVLFGLFVFGENAPAFWGFFNHGGAAGRLTLFDWLGVDAGVVVLGVVVMAVGAFAFAEIMERVFARAGEAPKFPSPRARVVRRCAAGAAAAMAVVTLVIGQPSVERQVAWASAALDQSVRDRRIHIDPAELLDLMHNNQVQVVLADVRPEADYNVFHLLDAQNVNLRQLDSGWAAAVPNEAVVVVMSNDEQSANEAWKRLAVQLNADPSVPVGGRSRVYVLAGGVNRWLDLYDKRQVGTPGPETAPAGDDICRHQLTAALGSRHTAARPEIKTAPKRDFIAKVQAVKPVRHVGGGCG